MITADPKSLLGMICRDVDAMKPGQQLLIVSSDLRGIRSYHYNDAEFTPADRILGNIVGSAFTHSYDVDYKGDVIFRRHEDTGQRRYTDPDRRP